VWSGPEDIREAILLIAQRMRDLRGGALGKERANAGSAGSVQFAATSELTAAIPKEAKELLAPYQWDTRSVF
jgi:hypothetical protein